VAARKGAVNRRRGELHTESADALGERDQRSEPMPSNDQFTQQTAPTLQDRILRLPEALLLTAGYYVSRVPVLNELIRRLD
jgi:hypothetical protein